MNKTLKGAALATLGGLVLAAGAASAQTPRAWTGGTSSDWFDETNWDGGVAPQAFDPVTISGGAVDLTNSPPVLGGLLLDNGAQLNLYAQPTNGLAPWGLDLAVSGTVSLAANSWINPYSNPTNGGSRRRRFDRLLPDSVARFRDPRALRRAGRNLIRAEPATQLEYWNGGMMGVETEGAQQSSIIPKHVLLIGLVGR